MVAPLNWRDFVHLRHYICYFDLRNELFFTFFIECESDAVAFGMCRHVWQLIVHVVSRLLYNGF